MLLNRLVSIQNYTRGFRNDTIFALELPKTKKKKKKNPKIAHAYEL
jgi:hypothetical protein